MIGSRIGDFFVLVLLVDRHHRKSIVSSCEIIPRLKKLEPQIVNKSKHEIGGLCCNVLRVDNGLNLMIERRKFDRVNRKNEL